MALAMTDVPSPNKKRGGVPKTVWDLVFTLLIPILILSPNILGSGISVSELVFGGGSAGNIRAYILAAVVPVVYVIVDLLLTRHLSPIALFGGATALLNGALTFWYVDGALYAFKDSLLRFLIAAFALASVWTRIPLFRVFLDGASVAESPEHRAATGVALKDGGVGRALLTATLLLAAAEVLAGLVNFFLNLHLVTAKFGTDAFNAQKASADAVMRFPSILMFLAGFFLGYLVVQRAVTARWGKGANLFEPEQLTKTLKERGELG